MKPIKKLTLVGKMKLYDRLYEIADFLLKKHNPCGHSNGKCGGMKTYTFQGGCCGECEHLRANGCSVKALYCKLWVCGAVNTEILHKQLKALINIASYNDLLDCRERRQYTMARLNRKNDKKRKMKELLKSIKFGIGFKNRVSISTILYERS
jgi:hypothetical protein